MKLKRNLYVYLVFWSVIILFIVLKVTPHPTGEWDDYSIVTASLINDQNVSIDEKDVIFAKQFFSDLSNGYDNNYSLSGFKTRNGDDMSWYFCTYSATCVPIALVLAALNISPSYCFYLTNIIIMILALYLCIKEYSGTNKKKVMLILMLSINPIIFYMTWISAEVFIYALMVMAILWWHEKKFMRSAVVLSLASTLNPVILVVGIFMIIEFLYTIIKKYDAKTIKAILSAFIKEWRSIMLYGSCYIIGLIPFFYNYYEIGHINLTALSFATDEPKIMVFRRFLAYLFDWNFGLLPYYNLLFILSIVLFIVALLGRCWKYVGMTLAFYGVIAGYSIMYHINCGMSGISRYNAWSAVIMVFGVISFADILITRKIVKSVAVIFISITIIINSLILYFYGPIEAKHTNYVYMTPIASFVLDCFPSLYSPLYSTFNSRVTHIDGGYSYALPLIYKNREGNIRKILVAPDSIEDLKSRCIGEDNKDQEWFNQRISNITKEEYISVPPNYNIRTTNQLSLNQKIYFSGDSRNCDFYVDKGISWNEIAFAWTDGKEVFLSFNIKDFDSNLHYILDCNIIGTYMGVQSMVVKERNKITYKDMLSGQSYFQIPLSPSESGYVKLHFIFDNAVSPLELGESADNRVLALQFESATLLGK
jgi:hypothetical protein